MSGLQNVAIAGVVVKELLASGFNITALQRPASTATFPDGVNVKRVIHDSFDSWTMALEGQDAVISFLVPPATDYQNLAAEAAVAAKVKRFIPSEWSMDTTILGDTTFGKLLSDKTSTHDNLYKLSTQNEFFSWTGISTGLWFDWGLEHLSLSFDKSTRTAEIADSGVEKFQTSNLGFVAKVVAAVLNNPTQTCDKYIPMASFNISQVEILALAEKALGEKWTAKPYKVSDAQRAAKDALAKGDLDAAFYPLLHGRLLRDGAGLALQHGQNFATGVLELRCD
ncbi:hypothetical protein FALBO_9493 [Fusarium albosuccineum]|uniref:NmrA-like domain-containing protein n=1 Tax=Fusarium albosuccineum TaxID=1237068 RepID=A0A8H4P5V9_9HYPO|nr:hypothetical protein FALBO_9493 [Fusarium albosuccineum]